MNKIEYNNKYQSSAYNTAKFNAADANEIKTKFNEVINHLKEYISYTGLISFSSAGFTQKVLKNDLGVDLEFTNPQNGRITIEGAEGLFTVDKTFITIGSMGVYNMIIYPNLQYLPDSIVLIIKDITDGSQSSTPYFNNLPIEIKIYK